MILFNLCGGPGAGKTTASYYLLYRLKKAGYRAEFVGEAAREIIYAGHADRTAEQLLDNQVLLLGLQYERTLRLKRHGVQVAISDSPIVQGAMYCKQFPFYRPLVEIMRTVEREFRTCNIFIERNFPYDPESRVQRTEAAARAHDKDVKELIGDFWLEVKAGQEVMLANRVLKLLQKIFPTGS